MTRPMHGGVRGHPWHSTLGDLTAHGYVEEEFSLAGSATAVGEGGPGAPAAYQTRLIVRRPSDTRRFNGTVLVEWLNDTGTVNLEFGWVYLRDLLIRRGYAWVGVSAQKIGVDGGPQSLKHWDPVRYGALHHPGDEWAPDIFSRAGSAVRRPSGAPPLGALRAKHLIATGTSQAAGHLVTYVNTTQSTAGVFDGFLIQSGNGSVRDDIGVPVIKIQGQGEELSARQADFGRFRLWEEAGAAHTVKYWWDYGRQVLARDAVAPLVVGRVANSDPTDACPQPINRYPRQFTMRAGLVHLDRWIRGGTPAPSAPRIATRGTELDLDEHGNAIGGLRLPTVDVPTATYTYTGGCLANHGTTTPFSIAKLRALYPSPESYRAKVRAASRDAVARGFLLQEDARELLAESAALDIWSE